MKKILVYSLTLYKKLVSPALFQLIGNGCRYNPTCSDYAVEAIEVYGATKGVKVAIKRLVRCHPFTKHPQFDPVPASTFKKIR